MSRFDISATKASCTTALALPLVAGKMREAKYHVGAVVRHKFYDFRGIVVDIDPVFNSSEEWWLSIPEDIRPRKDQPFYHLLAENDQTEYKAYVSEQNLITDTSGAPLRHPQVVEMFDKSGQGYKPNYFSAH
jgi:heat shock protein HspQ